MKNKLYPPWTVLLIKENIIQPAKELERRKQRSKPILRSQIIKYDYELESSEWVLSRVELVSEKLPSCHLLYLYNIDLFVLSCKLVEEVVEVSSCIFNTNATSGSSTKKHHVP